MTPRVALVTGAGRGIGLAVARRLAAAGYRVHVGHRPEDDRAPGVCASLRDEGLDCRPIALDVRDEDGVARALAAAEVASLDVLVNNAGITRDALIAATTDAQWSDVLGTNFGGAVHVLRACLPALRAADRPLVINVGSIAAHHGGPGQTAYAASKAALVAWTRALARELGGRPRVYAVSPGPVATEMLAAAGFYQRPEAARGVPVRRFADPAEIGELALWLAERGEVLADGSEWVVDGGLTLSTKPG